MGDGPPTSSLTDRSPSARGDGSSPTGRRSEATTLELQPTTLADCERFLGAQPSLRIRAMTAHVDGEPVAIGGLTYTLEGDVVAFLEGYAAVKRFPVAIHKAVLRGLQEARARGVRRIVALADEDVEAAPRWLERLGFKPAGAGAFLWEA